MSRFIALLSLTISLVACAAGPVQQAIPPQRLADRTYAAVDDLLAGLPGELRQGAVVIVASLANIDDLSRSSTSGRVVSEQIGTRLVQRGYIVPELKLAETVQMRDNSGEFMLSRRLQEIRRTLNADAVVTGTFGLGNNVSFVNLRLIRLADGRVLAATDYEMPRTDNELASRR